MVDCLRTANADKLLALSLNTTGTNGIRHFVPTGDGVFIPEDVDVYVEENSASPRKVRTIIGYAKDKGSLFVRSILLSLNHTEPQTLEDIIGNCEDLFVGYNHHLDFKDGRIRKLISESYVDEHPDNAFNAIAAFEADGVFMCPINKFVRSFARHNDQVYAYHFERKLQSTYWGVLNPKQLGAFHFSPFLHFAGVLLAGDEPVEAQDRLFSMDSVTMISNFAKTREAPHFRGVEWPSFPTSGEIIVLDEIPSIQRGLSGERECQALLDVVVEGGPSILRSEL